MKDINLERLRSLQSEMQRKFERWDDAIENKQQPVPVQDLDFWATELRAIINTEAQYG